MKGVPGEDNGLSGYSSVDQCIITKDDHLQLSSSTDVHPAAMPLITSNFVNQWKRPRESRDYRLSMSALSFGDKLEVLARKCIVFPAGGSETHIVQMVAPTVTYISSLIMYSHRVDMIGTFGDDYRKTRSMVHKITRDGGVQSTYIIFYNLSPNLPINLNVAHVVGVTPSDLKTRKRLFWRGDVVAMKVQPQAGPQKRYDFIVESLDADLSELSPLEELLREKYQVGFLEGRVEVAEISCK